MGGAAGASGFSGWWLSLSRPPQDCVSVYNIYICMYCSRFCTDHALCQVVPIKAAPRASLPGFLIRGRGMEGGADASLCPVVPCHLQ